MKTAVGFIGLGHMGQAMALRLADAGFELRVYNRTPEKAQPLVERGAIRVDEPEDVATQGGIVISSLSKDDVVEKVIGSNDALLERLGRGGIHISMSTIAPETAKRVVKGHAKYGVAYVAAPVVGRPDVIPSGRLRILVSGPEAAKERAVPVLEAISKNVSDLGTDPMSAHVAKLGINFLIASAMEAMAEAFAFAEKNGLQAARMADLITSTLFACQGYQSYAREIAERRFEPALFALELGLKDLTLVVETANKSATPMPLAGLVHDRMLSGYAKGRGQQDWAVLTRGVMEDAGLSM